MIAEVGVGLQIRQPAHYKVSVLSFTVLSGKIPHCLPKIILDLGIKTESITVGADVTVHVRFLGHIYVVVHTKAIPLLPLQM